jgi:hypothetical protein
MSSPKLFPYRTGLVYCEKHICDSVCSQHYHGHHHGGEWTTLRYTISSILSTLAPMSTLASFSAPLGYCYCYCDPLAAISSCLFARNFSEFIFGCRNSDYFAKRCYMLSKKRKDVPYCKINQQSRSAFY